MKWIKIFSAFILIHLSGWAGTHWYLTSNPQQVVIVADTSYSMKPHFPAMESWITEFQDDSRYKKILIGTDKANLGELDDLKSKSVIFRTSFGRIKAEALKPYEKYESTRRILLSDGSLEAAGWELIRF